jgi:hypothetical protein
MILGITGKMQAGKDTVANYALNILNEYYTNSVFNEKMFYEQWQIRRFADKVKKIASLLTGIPQGKFEDGDFKNTYISTEWDFMDKRMTGREFLQKLGTDAIRNHLHPNTWVNALMSDYHKFDSKFDDGHISNGGNLESNWIISDMRFENEYEAIRQKGGITVRVVRPSYRGNIGATHISETALDHKEVDYVIWNVGDLHELKIETNKMLQFCFLKFLNKFEYLLK